MRNRKTWMGIFGKERNCDWMGKPLVKGIKDYMTNGRSTGDWKTKMMMINNVFIGGLFGRKTGISWTIRHKNPRLSIFGTAYGDNLYPLQWNRRKCWTFGKQVDNKKSLRFIFGTAGDDKENLTTLDRKVYKSRNKLQTVEQYKPVK